MNASKEELLKKLEQLRKERHALADRFYHNSTDDDLDRELDCYDQAITRTEIEYDVALMRDHLISNGSARATWMSGFDSGVYKIAKFNGLIYLEYMIDYFCPGEKNKYGMRKLDRGRMIHDTNGNIIFEEHELDVPNRESYKFDRTKISYEEINPESIFTYMDAENFIIKTKGKNLVEYTDQDNNCYRLPEEYDVYKHYQLRNGKYTLINDLKESHQLGSLKIDFKLLDVVGPSKICQCFGKIYDIDSGCFLTTATFDKILDRSCGTMDMPNLGCQPADIYNKVAGIMKKYNLLVGVKRCNFNYDAHIDTMVYMDIKGHILGDLIYYVNLENYDLIDRDDEICSIETTDETYNNDILKVVNLAKDYEEKVSAKYIQRINERHKLAVKRNRKRLKFISNSYKAND